MAVAKGVLLLLFCLAVGGGFGWLVWGFLFVCLFGGFLFVGIFCLFLL